MMSGLPGSGKSHLARALAIELRAVIVSVDPIEDAMIQSGLPMSFETGVAAYQVGAVVAAAQLHNGFAVIADAANYLEVGRDTWRTVAAESGVALKAIEVICSDTELHRTRLEGRRRGLRAYPEPSWHDILRRAAEVEAWTSPRLVLDSASEPSAMLEAARRYLDARPAFGGSADGVICSPSELADSAHSGHDERVAMTSNECMDILTSRNE